jgi:hypothetical protein
MIFIIRGGRMPCHESSGEQKNKQEKNKTPQQNRKN